MRASDQVLNPSDAVAMQMGLLNHDSGIRLQGEVFIRMVDEQTGEVLYDEHRKNLIVLDASILLAMLCKGPSTRPLGINMLAVGTGATGALLSPNAPDNRQRKLNAEISRKGFTSTIFRDSTGAAVAYPTNVVDFTTTFSAAEAVGPLNEMGLMATISANPAVRNLNPNTYPTRDTTVDVSTLDILVNYITMSVVSKPSSAQLTITWRLTW